MDIVALSLARLSAGSSRAAKMAMMAITTRSSMSVNPTGCCEAGTTALAGAGFLSLASFTVFIRNLFLELFLGITPLGERHPTCAAECGAGGLHQHENIGANARRNGGAQCVVPLKLFLFRGAHLGASLVARDASPERRPS